MNTLRRLWKDDHGAVVSVEILVIATILVIGLMAAWSSVRNAVFAQIEDQADWISGENGVDQVDNGENLENDIITCSHIFSTND